MTNVLEELEVVREPRRLVLPRLWRLAALVAIMALGLCVYLNTQPTIQVSGHYGGCLNQGSENMAIDLHLQHVGDTVQGQCMVVDHDGKRQRRCKLIGSAKGPQVKLRGHLDETKGDLVLVGTLAPDNAKAYPSRLHGHYHFEGAGGTSGSWVAHRVMP